MPTPTDVLVLGGGPAGAAAAIECARTGLSVRLLEASEFPRPRPGETLPPGAETLLRKLGVFDSASNLASVRHAGTIVHWDGPPRFEPFGIDGGGPWRGFQISRAALDSVLLDEASRLGVDVLQPCRARDTVVAGGSLRGIRSENGELRARYVVDASGGGHWLARRLGVAIRRASGPLAACYGYCDGDPPSQPPPPAITTDPHGWTWTAWIGGRTFHWTRLNFRPMRFPADWRPDVFRQMRPLGRPRGADVTWRIAEKPAGPGFLLAGDAAMVVDPVSGHGVLRAWLTGILAARTIRLALDRNAHSAACEEAYARCLLGWFERETRSLRDLYRRHPAGFPTRVA